MSTGDGGSNGGRSRGRARRGTGATPYTAIKWSLVALGLILVFILLSVIKGIYTDWLWFDSLGFTSVYAKVLVTRIWLFFASALFFAILLGGNIYLAGRFSRGESNLPLPAETQRLLHIGIRASVCFAAFLMSLVFGLVASGRWETFIRFMNAVPFNVQDPLYHHDIIFYVATLPVLNFIQGWFLGAVIAIAVSVVGVYLINFSLRGVRFVLTPAILAHLAGLGACLMLVIAAKHFLDIYGLVLSSRGVAFGAGYADVHAALPVLRLMVGVAMAAAILFPVGIFIGGQRLMVGAFGLWAGAAIVVGWMYPALFQRFVVNPNELTREEVYIARNIEATREAYGLDRIVEVPFPVTYGLTAETVARNPETIGNIRLWDHGPLRDTYNQLQFISLYYSFTDVDVDRYVIDGAYRQVMLSARELYPENLPAEAQRWVNRKLQYTHGYGVAMSPVNEFTPEGQPLFFLKDIPPTGELEVDRPGIYYGENTKDYVIVNTKTPEFDYPGPGDVPFYARYEGDGGVPMSSPLRRMAYAWQMGDINVLISGQITPESRIQYRRQVQERVRTVAPFLRLDGDPYLVVVDGKLWWIQDAYTVTHSYPYSTPLSASFGSLNYIRNSVKVVVDPYHGSFTFYVVDPQDPVLQMYRRAFPVLFKPFEEMPQSLKSHVRYPEGLFSIQSKMYLQYHMKDPRVFFNKEDQWTIPTETFFGKQKAVEPYYVIMKLPGETREEFVLILPFTPKGKPKMVAWLAARADGEHYGELLALIFPKDQQVHGPSQVEARIDNDPVISQQFTLWGQAGSQIIRGNLLTIPIEETVIYVEPVFLQAENFQFPELKQVIVATTESVEMRSTLEEALLALVGEAPPVVSPTPGPGPGLPSETMEKLKEEMGGIQDGVQRLKESLQALEDALDGLNQTLRGESE